MGLFNSFKKKNRQEDNSKELQEENISVRSESGVPECRPRDFLFEIRDIFALKEQGCVLVGEVANGEIAPGTKVAYLDQNGKKIFNCTIDAIEQNGIKMKKAPACYMGVYGPNFSFMIKDFAPNAFQKGNFLYLEAEGEAELTPLEMAFEECRLPRQRKKELEEMFEQGNYGEEAVSGISIQDTVFLMNTARNRMLQKEGTPEENAGWEAAAKQLYQAVADKVKALDTVFLTFDKNTGFPFLNNGFVDVYSSKEYAELAVLYYSGQFRELEVKELPVSRPDKVNITAGEGETKETFRAPAFALFYYLGMERVFLNNGLCRAVLKREDILPPPDYTGLPAIQVPVVNPALRLRILDFFAEARWKVNYEKRNVVLKAKEDAMLKEVAGAKFLIPMKYDGKAAKKTGENQITFQKDTRLMFAGIKNASGEMFTPVFTDFTEFGKLYPVKEWGGAVVTIQDAIQISKGRGIVINPAGENLVLHEKAIGAVQEIIRAEKEAKKADKPTDGGEIKKAGTETPAAGKGSETIGPSADQSNS